MSAALDQLIQDMADELAAHPTFSAIPIYAEKGQFTAGGDIYEDLLAAAVATYGVAVGVSLPPFSVPYPNAEGPQTGPVVVVTVHYNPHHSTSSRTPLLELAEKAASILHHFQPVNLSAPLYADSGFADVKERDGLLTVDLKFTGNVGLAYTVSQVATPALSQSGPNVTITCATSGASVFYTTNGTNPSPRNGAIYTGSFAPGSAVTVKARAFLAGYTASERASLLTV
jgi:hypothetical protein